MITKELALSRQGKHTILEHVSAKNADGTPVRARPNGKVIVWVKVSEVHPAGDFKWPVKYGLNRYFCITPANGADWVIAGLF